MVLMDQPPRGASVSELLARTRSSVLTETRVRKQLDDFAACGLVVEREGRYHCAPGSRAVQETIQALVHMYNERPVTLIRAIYARGDERIRAFSDAFDVRRNRSE